MTDPIAFPASSPRFSLPFLAASQAQKEFFVNEAFARCDALLHAVVEGESGTPPSDPAEGEGWIVATDAVGEWGGREGELAFRQGGSWLFVAPRDGVAVLDKGSWQVVRYEGQWCRITAPAAPTGGLIVDAEARSAIALLVAAMRDAAIFPRI